MDRSLGCHGASSVSSSGSVIAIYGAEKNDGKFTVEDFCMADLPQQTPRPALSSDRYTLTHTHTHTLTHTQLKSQPSVIIYSNIVDHPHPGLCSWSQDLVSAVVRLTVCSGYSCW